MVQTNMFPEQQTKAHNILDTWSNILSEDSINLALKIHGRIEKLRDTLTIYPESNDVFKVFDTIKPVGVKVVILGQDPYHNGNATGVSFACKKSFTPSFQQIWNSIKTTTEKEYDGKVDAQLEHLLNQGVFLLNTILTVEEGKPLSHKRFNWENFTSKVIHDISRTRSNIVFMLWGSYAKKYERFIDSNKHLILTDVHPVYSTYKGEKWDCNHFIKCNEYLGKNNIKPIKWR